MVWKKLCRSKTQASRSVPNIRRGYQDCKRGRSRLPQLRRILGAEWRTMCQCQISDAAGGNSDGAMRVSCCGQAPWATTGRSVPSSRMGVGAGKRGPKRVVAQVRMQAVPEIVNVAGTAATRNRDRYARCATEIRQVGSPFACRLRCWPSHRLEHRRRQGSEEGMRAVSGSDDTRPGTTWSLPSSPSPPPPDSLVVGGVCV